MTGVPVLIRFSDGHALAAADLGALRDGARNQAARHQRALHTPGIATGLTLSATDVPLTLNNQPVITRRITVARGIAVDGHGRQIVVPEDVVLAPELFLRDIGDAPEIDATFPGPGEASFPYPVLLTANVHDGPASAFTGGPCGGGGATTVLEDYQIRIGRRGEAQTLAAQPVPGPGDDLDDEARPFRLLLGFVRFHKGLSRYVSLQTALDGMEPLRAGVRAGEVVSGGDRLVLRVGDPAAAGQPAVVLDRSPDGGMLRFGPTGADGGVTDVFSVSAAGNLTVRGTIDPGLVIGVVRAQSGVATDGMPLPLPPGVTAEDVAAEKYVFHTQVRPVFPTAQPDEAFVVARCDVDDRMIGRCTLYKIADDGGNLALTAVLPAMFEYLVLAAVRDPALAAAP